MYELEVMEKNWGMEVMVSVGFRASEEDTHEAYQLGTLYETYSWANHYIRYKFAA
jgi:hypothetical protein